MLELIRYKQTLSLAEMTAPTKGADRSGPQFNRYDRTIRVRNAEFKAALISGVKHYENIIGSCKVL